MPGLALNLLGPIAFTVDDQPYQGFHIRPAVALCIYLACRPERHRREHLMALLWPDWPAAAAHKNLRQNVYTLRQALPTVASRDGRGPVPLVLADRETLQLNPEAAVELDVDRFTALLRQNSPEATAAAVGLYRGDFLADFYLPDSAAFEEWVAARRADLRHQMLAGLDRLAAHALDRDAFEEAAAYARRQLALDNLRESAHVQLMQALALQGQRSEALAQYDLCVRLLHTELGLEPAAETRTLAEAIASGKMEQTIGRPAGDARMRSGFATPPRHDLPLQLTSFIGRERQMGEVRRLLDSARLVTLTGAGGCGKSRLSLEVAGSLLEEYTDGVWWVELAPLDNSELVMQAVAFAIGLRDLSDRPIQEALIDYLRPRQALLVLDNCEHLVAACASLAESLLRACPSLSILATSREVLSIPGEIIYVVPSLDLPGPDHQPPDALAAVESVRLFIERAAAVRPGYALTGENTPAVAQICRRLDGIPLAIELAAARVKSLSAAQVAERLGDRFHLLAGGNRTALPRHQTLRAAIEWSYSLLSDPERRLFARLAVFRGGWTLEAAEAVCAGPDLSGFENLTGLDILDLLSHLVDKSLIMVKESDGVVRYSRLETIRQYGCEKLEESGELDQLRRRHLDYFLEFAERGNRELHGPHSLEWTRWMDLEQNNLRAALEYAFSAKDAGNKGVSLILALNGVHGFWSTRYWSESQFWLEKALKHPDALPGTALRAKLLFAYADFVGSSTAKSHLPTLEESLATFDALGEPYRVERAYVLMWLGCRLSYQSEGREKGTRYLQEAIQIFEIAGDKWGQAFTLNLVAGTILDLDYDFNAAWLLSEKGMEVARQSGEQWLIAVFIDNFGHISVRRGLYCQGQDYLEKALEVYRHFNNPDFACQTLKVLGDAARGLNDYNKAEAYYRESLVMAQELRWLSFQAWVCLFLGITLLNRGDVDQAMVCFSEAIDLGREYDYRFTSFHALDYLAATCAVQHKADVAAKLFGAFDAQLDALLAEGYARFRLFDAIDDETHEHFLSIARAQLDEATFEQCWQEGRELTLEEATQLALATTKG